MSLFRICDADGYCNEFVIRKLKRHLGITDSRQNWCGITNAAQRHYLFNIGPLLKLETNIICASRPRNEFRVRAEKNL